MLTDLRKKLMALAALAALVALAACTPEMQSAAGTALAPIAATWESNALTRAASGLQTSAVEIPQTAVAAGQTKVVQAITQAPGMLTPARPVSSYGVRPEDIIVYQVDKPIKVREAAYRFSTSSAFLIQWNQGKYPSITNEESVLQPGWTVVIFFGTSGRWDLVPYSVEAWNSIPGCNGTQAAAADGITCGEVTLDFVSAKGVLRPECLPHTMVGEYTVQSRYQGAVLYRNGAPFVYGVFFDAARNAVVTGPAIIRNRSDVVKCGK